MNNEIGVKISQMPKATAINETTVLAGVNNGVNQQVPVSLLKALEPETMTVQEFEAAWGK